MTVAFGDGHTASFTSLQFNHTLSVNLTNAYSASGTYVLSATMTATSGRTFTQSLPITVT
jgi:hypothetical protein